MSAQEGRFPEKLQLNQALPILNEGWHDVVKALVALAQGCRAAQFLLENQMGLLFTVSLFVHHRRGVLTKCSSCIDQIALVVCGASQVYTLLLG